MEKTKKQKDKVTTRIILNFLNSLCMSVLYIVMIVIFYDKNAEFDYGPRGYIVLSLLYLALYYIFNVAYGSYKLGNRKILDLTLSQHMSLFITDIIMFFILSLIEGHILYTRWPYVLLFVVQIILSTFLCYKNTLYIRNNFEPLSAIAIYNTDNYKKIIDKLKIYQQYEIDIKKSISEKELKNIDENLKKYDSVVCIDITHNFKKKIVKYCYENNKSIFDVPSITDMVIKSSEVVSLIDTPIFKLNKFGPNKVEKVLKRTMDIFGGILLLVLGLPFMLISIIIIKLQDGGDVFFKQTRLTKDGREFEMIKFRSMVMNAEPEGKMIKAKENDPRITKYGKFIRATRIDELPQVINILKGEMSFVGPRALRIEEYKENEKEFPEFKYRLKVQAGLTGYAQLYGKYNTSFRDKLLFDMYYIENYSLIEDIKLILMSFVNIFIKDSTQGF